MQDRRHKNLRSSNFRLITESATGIIHFVRGQSPGLRHFGLELKLLDVELRFHLAVDDDNEVAKALKLPQSSTSFNEIVASAEAEAVENGRLSMAAGNRLGLSGPPFLFIFRFNDLENLTC
jgi:hypothetical protein